jgi:hypothetical protein
MSRPATSRYRKAMTTGPDPAIVRPLAYIENVRADANRAAARAAEHAGSQPSSLASDTISWALGQQRQAPFSRQPAGSRSEPDIQTEIAACRTFLQTTPYSQEASDRIERAHAVLNLLEWLAGADDRPPTYCRETLPGDLVGGRGRIVRPHAEIRRMITMAQAKLASGQTSHALGTDWHEGVIATLQWVLGDCAITPIHGTAPAGLPQGPQIHFEQRAAEDHLASPGLQPAIPYHYADAVACTCRWLLGGTTTPPVTDDD